MIWSKLKKGITNRFSDTIRNEIGIYMNSYGDDLDFSGRAWVTINGKEVVNFSTGKSMNKYRSQLNELTTGKDWKTHTKIDEKDRGNELIEEGEFSRQDFTISCYNYLSMDIKEAQESEHPIIRMLAVLDKRTGKRKLIEMTDTESNPLVRYFIKYRMSKY